MKVFSIILFAFFAFIIWDACNMHDVKPQKWVAMVYVNGSYVGAEEITLNGTRGFKGEILRDTVELNGVVQYEEMVLTVKTSW